MKLFLFFVNLSHWCQKRINYLECKCVIYQWWHVHVLLSDNVCIECPVWFWRTHIKYIHASTLLEQRIRSLRNLNWKDWIWRWWLVGLHQKNNHKNSTHWDPLSLYIPLSNFILLFAKNGTSGQNFRNFCHIFISVKFLGLIFGGIRKDIHKGGKIHIQSFSQNQ